MIQEKILLSFVNLGFKEKRCIVDCSELYIQQPASNFVLQSVLFSSYKNHHTAQDLVAIAPHGPITFVADSYVALLLTLNHTRLWDS